MPRPAFPEITFRAAGVLPPMVDPDTAEWNEMPMPFGSAPVPAALVPIRLPWMRWPLPPLLNVLPTPIPAAEPESRLREAGVVPPIVTLATPMSSRMSNELGLATMPLGSVPRKLPSMTCPLVVLYATWIAVDGQRLITRPRMTLPLLPAPNASAAVRMPAPECVPSISIRCTELSPTPGPFVLGLEPGCVNPSITTCAEMLG